MDTVGTVLKDFVDYIKTQKNYNNEHIISQPLNLNKTTENEIEKTEKKLSCTIPYELRYYYLNEMNGTEVDEKEYPVYEEKLDIFSHQKIMGIYDYFKYYWEDIQEIDIEEILEHLSEEEILFIENNNREYFVFIADWRNNFIETFVFDKKENYYNFYFDQDVTIDIYINKMINSSNSIKKDKSLVKLLKKYLEKKKEEI